MRYIFLILISFVNIVSFAQLSAPGMKTLRYTAYRSEPDRRDPVFIFCRSDHEKGSLSASSPGGAITDFQWFRWSSLTNSFSESIGTQNGVTTSTITDLTDGGYRVVLTGGSDTSFTAWIHVDKPYVSAKFHNTCYVLDLIGKAVADTFYYRDQTLGIPLKLPNAVKFLWSSQPATAIPFPDFEISPRTYNPPLENVTYNLQVTDSFGCVNNASFLYESIHAKADFSADPLEGEAPLEVSFTDKSIRGNLKYTWDFGEKTPDGKRIIWEVDKDSIGIFSSPFTHKYYKPGEYTVNLTIESDRHCLDSFRLEKIVVEKSDLGIPNVFSPDGDGINDYFMVESKSLRWISVEVFSRSGMLVYRFIAEGDQLNEWKGWDGYVNNTSAQASPGVYFYIIKALGWDDVKYDSKEQRGFVYLYR